MQALARVQRVLAGVAEQKFLAASKYLGVRLSTDGSNASDAVVYAGGFVLGGMEIGAALTPATATAEDVCRAPQDPATRAATRLSTNLAGTGSTVSSSGQTVTGVNTQFLSDMPAGSLLSSGNDSATSKKGNTVRRVIAVASDTSLSVNLAFVPDLPALSIPYRIDPGRGATRIIGTASGLGTTLTGVNTFFLEELSVGCLIRIGTQAAPRIVTAIASNTSLTLSSAGLQAAAASIFRVDAGVLVSVLGGVSAGIALVRYSE